VTKRPIEYFQRPDIIAAAIFPPDVNASPTSSKGGETDVSHLACVERLARLSDDGDVVVMMAGATYRGRHVKGVGSIVCSAVTGHSVCKSSMRMIRRAFIRLGEAAEQARLAGKPDVDDDERTQVYHPGAAVLMTVANDGVAT
jgi:hypothetical protein